MTNMAMFLLYKAYSFGAYALPMLLLFLINMDAYKTDGSLFGFWGIVILAFVFIAFKTTFINLIKNRTLMTVSGLFLVFSILMQYVAQEMVLISFISFVGAIAQSFLDCVADVYENHSYYMDNGIKRRNRRRAIKQKDAWAEAYGFFGGKHE